MIPLQFVFLRIVSSHGMSTRRFLSWHIHSLETTGEGILHDLNIAQQTGVWPYLFFVALVLTITLTFAAITWYMAVSLTSTSDVTAMYNCSTFFAYVFSIPILGEQFRKDKMAAVLVSIFGVFLMAYADSGDRSPSSGVDPGGPTRLFGNIIIAGGAVLYGLYEVLYKKYGCPLHSRSPAHSMQFSNLMTSLIGLSTLLVIWIPLPILHFVGWEIIEIPSGKTLAVLLASMFSNVMFTASFLTMVSLTSPVLSSVGAMSVCPLYVNPC